MNSIERKLLKEILLGKRISSVKQLLNLEDEDFINKIQTHGSVINESIWMRFYEDFFKCYCAAVQIEDGKICILMRKKNAKLGFPIKRPQLFPKIINIPPLSNNTSEKINPKRKARKEKRINNKSSFNKASSKPSKKKKRPPNKRLTIKEKASRVAKRLRHSLKSSKSDYSRWAKVNKEQLEVLNGKKADNKGNAPYTEEQKSQIQKDAAYRSGSSDEIKTGMRD